MNAIAYKITGVVAAAMLAATGVSAQDMQAAPTETPAVTAPMPATAPAAAPAQTMPATPPTTVTTPETTPSAQMNVEAVADTSARDFIREAFLANEFGIAAAQVALKNAENEEVRAVARKILTDGEATRANMITAIQGATTDVQFDQSWTPEHKAQLAELSNLTGAEFDARYLELQSDVNANASEAFGKYAQTGTDASVKTFATNTQPMLEAQADALAAAAQGGN